MKWNYLKNGDYPKWYSEIIVKCADGEVLKTGYSSYDDDEDYHKKSFAVSFYDDEGFDANMGSLKWINVVAWCYIDDVYKELETYETVNEMKMIIWNFPHEGTNHCTN